MKTLLVQDGIKETVLHQCLVEEGCEVVVSRSVQEAKDRWSGERFPLVVLDLSEAKTSASDLCGWLRTRPGGDRAFILVGTRAVKAEEVAAAVKAGADEVLMKPYQPRMIRLRLMLAERQVKQRLEWQQLHEALNTRAQQQVLIAALGQCALLEADQPTMSSLLTLSTTFVREMLEVEFCNVLELSDDGQTLRFVAGLGWKEGHIGQVLPLSLSGSVTSHTLEKEDVIVADLERDGRFPTPDFLRDHGVTSGISVAIKGKEKQALGILAVWTGQRRVFPVEDLHFLQALANVLGAAMEHRRLQRQIQHLQRLEAVGQLAAGLAHDYNNVLTIIHGHVTLALGESGLSENVGRCLETALQAVERAASLTRQLLAFSRKHPIAPEAIDLNSVAASTIRLLDRVLGPTIRIEFERGAALPAVQADTGMIEQVLMNLAVNARDAMPTGGTLTITTARVEVPAGKVRQHPEVRQGEFVCLSVRDSGCGMNDATLHRIFDPFFTTKEPGKGTGLGLATVYGIVKQHEGWIEVDSTPGAGSTFRVFLPSLGKTLEPLEAAGKPPKPIGGTETILLVEDEPSLRELARLLLEDLGYHVLEAGSGSEAIKIWDAQKDQINALLTDLVLPDRLTGFDLAKRLQQARPGLKVIVASGYNAEEVCQGIPAKRAFHFIQKPYRAETLGRTIRQALDGGS